jgi:hypothetical protein
MWKVTRQQQFSKETVAGRWDDRLNTVVSRHSTPVNTKLHTGKDGLVQEKAH